MIFSVRRPQYFISTVACNATPTLLWESYLHNTHVRWAWDALGVRHGYIQGDLNSFFASGASFLGRQATERAKIFQVINSRNSSFLTVNQET